MTSACLEQLLPIYYTRMTDYESDIYWVNQIRISQSWMLASNLFMDFQDVIPYRRALEQHFYISNEEILLLEVLRHFDPVQSLRSISSRLLPPPFPETIIHTVLLSFYGACELCTDVWDVR
jgi:hypothetical protein